MAFVSTVNFAQVSKQVDALQSFSTQILIPNGLAAVNAYLWAITGPQMRFAHLAPKPQQSGVVSLFLSDPEDPRWSIGLTQKPYLESYLHLEGILPLPREMVIVSGLLAGGVSEKSFHHYTLSSRRGPVYQLTIDDAESDAIEMAQGWVQRTSSVVDRLSERGMKELFAQRTDSIDWGKHVVRLENVFANAGMIYVGDLFTRDLQLVRGLGRHMRGTITETLEKMGLSREMPVPAWWPEYRAELERARIQEEKDRRGY